MIDAHLRIGNRGAMYVAPLNVTRVHQDGGRRAWVVEGIPEDGWRVENLPGNSAQLTIRAHNGVVSEVTDLHVTRVRQIPSPTVAGTGWAPMVAISLAGGSGLAITAPDGAVMPSAHMAVWYPLG